MLPKNRPLLFVTSLTVAFALSATLFSGCTPEPQSEVEQTVAPEQDATLEPATEAAEPAEPEESPSEPQAMLVEPAGKVGSDMPAAPEAPEVSTFAPAEDLANEADRYIEELERCVADEEDYNDSKNKIAQDSNTLIVIALALGLHDRPSKYKDSAGALIKAAREVAAAKDFEAAKKAVATVKDAADGKGEAGTKLKWEKVASLPELMKQVPLINTKLKRYVKPKYFEKRAEKTIGYTAVIAAIAQGSLADTSEAKDAEQATQWYGFSAAMRDAAGAVNAAIHDGDEPAAAAAMEKLNQSCEDCHAVFHPEAE